MSKEILLKFISSQSYKRNSPDKNNPVNVIPSNNITMEDVDFPVHGMDDQGNEQVMYPGEEYQFPGKYVVETPLRKAQYGFFEEPVAVPLKDLDKERTFEERAIARFQQLMNTRTDDEGKKYMTMVNYTPWADLDLYSKIVQNESDKDKIEQNTLFEEFKPQFNTEARDKTFVKSPAKFQLAGEVPESEYNSFMDNMGGWEQKYNAQFEQERQQELEQMKGTGEMLMRPEDPSLPVKEDTELLSAHNIPEIKVPERDMSASDRLDSHNTQDAEQANMLAKRMKFKTDLGLDITTDVGFNDYIAEISKKKSLGERIANITEIDAENPEYTRELVESFFASQEDQQSYATFSEHLQGKGEEFSKLNPVKEWEFEPIDARSLRSKQDVIDAQTKLYKAGYDLGEYGQIDSETGQYTGIDGIMGPMTKGAIETYNSDGTREHAMKLTPVRKHPVKPGECTEVQCAQYVSNELYRISNVTDIGPTAFINELGTTGNAWHMSDNMLNQGGQVVRITGRQVINEKYAGKAFDNIPLQIGDVVHMLTGSNFQEEANLKGDGLTHVGFVSKVYPNGSYDIDHNWHEMEQDERGLPVQLPNGQPKYVGRTYTTHVSPSGVLKDFKYVASVQKVTRPNYAKLSGKRTDVNENVKLVDNLNKGDSEQLVSFFNDNKKKIANHLKLDETEMMSFAKASLGIIEQESKTGTKFYGEDFLMSSSEGVTNKIESGIGGIMGTLVDFTMKLSDANPFTDDISPEARKEISSIAKKTFTPDFDDKIPLIAFKAIYPEYYEELANKDNRELYEKAVEVYKKLQADWSDDLTYGENIEASKGIARVKRDMNFDASDQENLKNAFEGQVDGDLRDANSSLLMTMSILNKWYKNIKVRNPNMSHEEILYRAIGSFNTPTRARDYDKNSYASNLDLDYVNKVLQTGYNYSITDGKEFQKSTFDNLMLRQDVVENTAKIPSLKERYAEENPKPEPKPVNMAEGFIRRMAMAEEGTSPEDLNIEPRFKEGGSVYNTARAAHNVKSLLSLNFD